MRVNLEAPIILIGSCSLWIWIPYGFGFLCFGGKQAIHILIAKKATKFRRIQIWFLLADFLLHTTTGSLRANLEDKSKRRAEKFSDLSLQMYVFG